MKIIFSFLVLVTLCCDAQNSNLKELHFFEGTWKMENTEIYETWKLTDHSASLEGSSYKLAGSNKQVNEYLTLTIRDSNIIYTAKVPDQNSGRPIEFILNNKIKDKFSFENPQHDFPKKIQYIRLNDSTLLVGVLGDYDKGFFYNLIRQKATVTVH